MTTTRTTIGTRLAVVAPNVVALVALAVTGALLSPRLPARIATHFGADGRADGSGSPWPIFWLTLALCTASAVTVVLALRARDRRTGALLVLVAALLGPIVAAAWIVIAVLARSGSERFEPWWTLLFLAVGVVAAAISVPPLWRSAAPVPARESRPLDVGPEARVAWRSHVGSPWFALLGLVLVVLGAATAVWTATTSAGSAVVAGAAVVVAGLALLWLARVEVTVDRRGLRVTSAWTRVPVMRVPLDRIDSCGWEQVSPGQWGGWGYRISGRGIAYVSRSGPGIVVRLRGGGARAVTVDDAERGAAALGALLERTPA
ncbi:DUF1648 domain-containing protein [Curtobacterium sp. 458]|uniref:DUF1648 domain-containing protein n=1 Tax=Curtobacterium sp. 458 TaxID=3050069 RepID=UPI0025B5C224|nr:DUF1648 domain-containing protein [Curtobacterium sp. 458]WJX99884.1 DUF1648 domain-containing protein [Curtobacterium sp. 458]